MRTGSKIFGFVAIAAIAIGVLTAPTAAHAEETTLCQQDPGESSCPEGDVATHVHETTLAGHKAVLKTSLGTIECDVLFLGNTVEETDEPLVISGNFTYSNCTGSAKCIVFEENEPSEIEVSKQGHETATATGEGLVHAECGLNCRYNGTGLKGTAKGPLLSTTETNGEVTLTEQVTNKESGTFCPSTSKLTITTTPLEALYIAKGAQINPHKTALCTTDEATATCIEDHKPSSVDFKDSAVEFLANLLNSKCEGLISGTPGAAGKPQEVKVEYKYSSCTNSCVITEVSGGSKLFFLLEGEYTKESATATTEGLELFVKCGSTVKCTFGPVELSGDGLGALTTKDNGHITFSKASLGAGEGATCPSTASLDALFVASSPTYIREDYVKAKTALCTKDEGTPICKSENQLKTIDYKDKAVELLTSLINVKCEGLVSGTVGEPGNPLKITAELTYSSCSGGCFVTAVSGPGTISLEREGKAEEATATSEGFEVFVKCGTTIKCLLGPEKMTSKALGALTTGDNGHLTFSKVSLGKGEGATCPSEATLDALYVASSAAYIG